MDMTDAQLQREVEELVESEPTIDSSHIEVKAELGFINLDGSVTSEEQKIAVEELIMENSEAKKVFNYLVIRPVGLFGESHT